MNHKDFIQKMYRFLNAQNLTVEQDNAIKMMINEYARTDDGGSLMHYNGLRRYLYFKALLTAYPLERSSHSDTLEMLAGNIRFAYTGNTLQAQFINCKGFFDHCKGFLQDFVKLLSEQPQIDFVVEYIQQVNELYEPQVINA